MYKFASKNFNVENNAKIHLQHRNQFSLSNFSSLSNISQNFLIYPQNQPKNQLKNHQITFYSTTSSLNTIPSFSRTISTSPSKFSQDKPKISLFFTQTRNFHITHSIHTQNKEKRVQKVPNPLSHRRNLLSLSIRIFLFAFLILILLLIIYKIFFKDNEKIFFDLRNKKLKEFPSELINHEKPDHIIAIDLSNNMIEEIPIEVKKFINLKHLRLSGNKIKEVNPEIFYHLKDLEILDLSHNLISIFPSYPQDQSINSSNENLKNLNNNNLNNNNNNNNNNEEINNKNEEKKLENRKQKKRIFVNDNLKFLILSHNNIKQINGIIDCKTLNTIELSSNNLSEISPNIRKLPNLQKLNLSSNQINFFHINREDFLELLSLDLSGNPIDFEQSSFDPNFSLSELSISIYIKNNEKEILKFNDETKEKIFGEGNKYLFNSLYYKFHNNIINQLNNNNNNNLNNELIKYKNNNNNNNNIEVKEFQNESLKKFLQIRDLGKLVISIVDDQFLMYRDRITNLSYLMGNYNPQLTDSFIDKKSNDNNNNNNDNNNDERDLKREYNRKNYLKNNINNKINNNDNNNDDYNDNEEEFQIERKLKIENRIKDEIMNQFDVISYTYYLLGENEFIELIKDNHKRAEVINIINEYKDKITGDDIKIIEIPSINSLKQLQLENKTLQMFALENESKNIFQLVLDGYFSIPHLFNSSTKNNLVYNLDEINNNNIIKDIIVEKDIDNDKNNDDNNERGIIKNEFERKNETYLKEFGNENENYLAESVMYLVIAKNPFLISFPFADGDQSKWTNLGHVKITDTLRLCEINPFFMKEIPNIRVLSLSGTPLLSNFPFEELTNFIPELRVINYNSLFQKVIHNEVASAKISKKQQS